MFLSNFMQDKPKGKNYSCNNTEGKRKESDFYETPFSITEQLVTNESFDKSAAILEPACGAGAIVKVLQKHGFSVTHFDKETDFLKFAPNEPVKQMVTNPPFSLAQEFILHAKRVVSDKFALLLPLSYLHGKSRYDEIYSDKGYPLARVFVFTRYPMLGNALREDGKYKTGMMVYAWFVWDKNYAESHPQIRWIDNHEYVIGARSPKKSIQ